LNSKTGSDSNFAFVQEERTRDKAINMLLECGADVNLTDDRNRTSLMYACEMRCNDVIKILLKTSVNPDIADIDGTYESFDYISIIIEKNITIRLSVF